MTVNDANHILHPRLDEEDLRFIATYVGEDVLLNSMQVVVEFTDMIDGSRHWRHFVMAADTTSNLKGLLDHAKSKLDREMWEANDADKRRMEGGGAEAA